MNNSPPAISATPFLPLPTVSANAAQETQLGQQNKFPPALPKETYFANKYYTVSD
jgi:hypothetical protein